MGLAAQPLPLPPSPGELIGDRFRVERELGAGGMGTVYAALDMHTGVLVALKLMRPALMDDEQAIERFRREGAALAAIRHPGVVQVREIGELPGGMLYLAMELLSGETLGDRLLRAGAMSLQELLSTTIALCDALGAAHAGGVIHRDIKPSNIHLCADGSVKLMDFGVARMHGYAQVTSSGLAVGTVRYMAPEQLSGAALDKRVDLYALGVVIYEALSGEHPFDRTAGEDAIGAILVGRATPLSTLRPDLSPAVTRFVHRAMARMAAERFESAPQLAEAFVAATRDHPLPSLPGPALGYAATALATPERPISVPPTSTPPIPRTSARPAPRRKLTLLWMILPLGAGLCALPTMLIAVVVGCLALLLESGSAVDLDVLRVAIHNDAIFADERADFDRLDDLTRAGDLSLFASMAFSERLQIAYENDQRFDRAEVEWVMLVGRDILAHHGDYSIEDYAKMHNLTLATRGPYRAPH